jgi:hypothetical protein
MKEVIPKCNDGKNSTPVRAPRNQGKIKDISGNLLTKYE